MDSMRQSATPEGLGRAQFLDGRIEALRDSVRDFVERNLLLFAKGETEKFREELLKSARLSNLERRDLDRMRVLVRQMARKLATRFAKTRRRRLRGQLDTRRTLRRNMGWGGIPFITVWKQRRIEKPRVMVLCDVSGSVAAMTQFLLMFVYAINEALSDIRSFAFAGSLIEVSDILERQPVEEAVARIMSLIGFGSSNYGNSFADFEDGWMRHVTDKTTVIILGDARGNRTDPRTDIVGRLSQRSKRIIWLNPEYRSAWGTGDSDMYRYAPFCNVLTVCNTLRHLERVISDILEDAG
ncbi:MAG: VWA domain-containing protein [Rhodopila sp.]